MSCPKDDTNTDLCFVRRSWLEELLELRGSSFVAENIEQFPKNATRWQGTGIAAVSCQIIL